MEGEVKYMFGNKKNLQKVLNLAFSSKKIYIQRNENLQKELNSVYDSNNFYIEMNELLEQRTQVLKDENRKLEEENQKIKRMLEGAPVKLSSLSIDGIRRNMAVEAWNGRKSDQVYVDFDGNPVIEFHGHTYEPHYEYFSSTCAVCGYDKSKSKLCLFDENDYSADAYLHKVSTTGSNETIEKFIKEHDCYVTLQTH
jgi:uncharacterized protein YggL (DUF469 family)